MAELEDDIARIAALRGKTVEEVQAADLRHRRVTAAEITNLFDVPIGYIEDDLEALDALPRSLRQAIAACPLIISAQKALILYRRTRDAGCIIAGINDQLPSAVGRQARAKYGPDHPAAKEREL